MCAGGRELCTSHHTLRLVAQRTIVEEDACPATKDPAACSRVFFGILNKGLYAASQSFYQLIAELLAKRGLANGDVDLVKVSDSSRGAVLAPWASRCLHSKL
jgi:hypothetical protein